MKWNSNYKFERRIHFRHGLQSKRVWSLRWRLGWNEWIGRQQYVGQLLWQIQVARKPGSHPQVQCWRFLLTGVQCRGRKVWTPRGLIHFKECFLFERNLGCSRYSLCWLCVPHFVRELSCRLVLLKSIVPALTRPLGWRRISSLWPLKFEHYVADPCLFRSLWVDSLPRNDWVVVWRQQSPWLCLLSLKFLWLPRNLVNSHMEYSSLNK